MNWENIVQKINDGEWELAREEIDKAKKPGFLDDTLALLDAAVCQQEDNLEGMYQSITEGMKCNGKNYELFVMLGNYYRQTNISQAYLCYEHADYYCDDKKDKGYISQCMEEMKRTFQDQIPSPLSVVIASYNNKEIMQNCIQSIRDTYPQSAYELVVVDNASTDGITQWLGEQRDILLIRNEENKGFGYGCNQGAKAAGAANDILFLNNDTIVPMNALFWLRMGLYENGKIGAAGAVSNSVANEQAITECIDSPKECLAYAKKNNIPNKNPYEQKIWLSGFAVLIKRQALDDIGLFDLRYGMGYYEDNDIGVRLACAGYQQILCKNSFIFHYGSKSFEDDRDSQLRLSGKNRCVFQEKWGFDIEQYTYARTDIINMIDEDKEQPIKVLEIGCGGGVNLSRIKYLWPNAIVWGTETNEKVAMLAKSHLNVINESIEDIDIFFEDNYFDYIIFNDVLETLNSPEKIVKRLKRHLKKDGCMLFSIFNLMHASVVVPLLKGEFTYGNMGVVREGHIRFFAVNDIFALMETCGLKVKRIEGTRGQEEIFVSQKQKVEALFEILAEDMKNLLYVYKFVVKTRKFQGGTAQ